MKKLFLLFISITLMVSCNSIVKDAEKQLEKTMMEMAKNPDTFSITNVKVVYESETGVVLQFITKGQNGFGGYSTSKCEYYYQVREDGAYEAVMDLDEDDSFNERAEGMLEMVEEFKELGKDAPEPEEVGDTTLKLLIDLWGRKVE